MLAGWHMRGSCSIFLSKSGDLLTRWNIVMAGMSPARKQDWLLADKPYLIPHMLDVQLIDVCAVKQHLHGHT